MRSPHLYDTLRRFCLGAFAAFHRDLDSGADLPFAFEEHGSYGRPTLYEYRPLVRGFIESQADRLYARGSPRAWRCWSGSRTPFCVKTQVCLTSIAPAS